MNWQENKLEISLFGATAMGFALVMMMSQYMHTGKRPAWMSVSYEMPRPRSVTTSEFDLAGRDVERNYINPQARQNNVAKSTHEIQDKSKSAPKVVDKSKNAKALSAAKAKKKPVFDVSLIQRDQVAAAATPAEDETPQNPPNPALDPVKKTTATESKPKPADEEKDWKKIFQTAPTQANMIEFVKEYYNGKVNDELYFEVVKDLLTNQNEQDQALGLYGLRSVFTTRSFTEAVHLEAMPEIQKKATLETNLESYLVLFNQPTRLGILDGALKTNEPEVVVKAAQVIGEGIAKIKSGETLGDNRDQRNPIATSNLSAYQKFIPTLQALQKNSDQQIASAAASVLTQIQSIGNIAQNP